MAIQQQPFGGLKFDPGFIDDMMILSTFSTTGGFPVSLQGKTLLVAGFDPLILLGSVDDCFFEIDTPPSSNPPPPGTDPPLPPVWPYPPGNIYQRDYWDMNFQMIRLDTKVFDFIAYEGDNTVMNLTGATVRFTAKWDYFDTDAAAVIKLDNAANGGITITDATNGKGTVTIPKTATSSLPTHRVDLVYDLKVRKSDATEHTIGRGILTVLPNATETI